MSNALCIDYQTSYMLIYAPACECHCLEVQRDLAGCALEPAMEEWVRGTAHAVASAASG